MIVYRNDLWVTGLKPEMVPVQIVLLDIGQDTGLKITISGVMEGDHAQKSRHWSGMAIDCFCEPWNAANRSALVASLKARLPDRLYDVIDETTHVHIEFDPMVDKVVVT
jgi:hypothetical protein